MYDITGKTIAGIIKVIFPKDQDVVYSCDNPISDHSSVVGLWGNLAEEGSISKIAGLKNFFKGKAKCFDCERCFNSCFKNEIVAGDAVIIRYEGPKGAWNERNAFYHWCNLWTRFR